MKTANDDDNNDDKIKIAMVTRATWMLTSGTKNNNTVYYIISIHKFM